MQWAHAVRLDLPEEATARETRWAAAALLPMVAALEASPVARASAAFSGAALGALARHGCGALLDRVRRRAGERQLELAATAMHGALLPLLPKPELLRQLALSDAENLRVFGDEIYRPATLWSPHLATDGYLEQVLAEAGFTVMLVDDRALPVRPWPADRLPASAAFPGLTLLPSAHEACELLRRERVGLATLRSLRPQPTDVASAIVTACDLDARSGTPRAFLEAAGGDRLVRLVEVVERLPASEPVRAPAGSDSASEAALASGRPFERWFRPDDALNARQWGLATLAAESCLSLEEAGLGAVPAVRKLRRTMDLSWRARAFESRLAPGLRERWFRGLAAAVDGARAFLPAERNESLAELVSELGELVSGPTDRLPPRSPGFAAPQPQPGL